jgi:hypothetical protein
MRHFLGVISSLLIALSIPVFGASSSDTEYKDAVLTLFSNGNFGMLTRDWCDARVPQLKAQTAKTFQAWWFEQGLSDIERRVRALYSAEQIAAVKTKVEGVRQNFYSRLDGLFADAVARCQDLAGYYKQFLNLRQNNAAQYEIINSRALPTASIPVSTPSTSSQTPQSQTSSNTGVLYTIPQLNTLIINVMAQAKGSRSAQEKAVFEKLKSLGTMYIIGVALKESFLGFENGKFKSKYPVYCRNDFEKEIGKTFVIHGNIEAFEYGWIELSEGCPRVPNTNGLKRSNLPDNLGLERKPLTAQEVKTKPGAGLSLNAIEGVYFNQTVQNRMDGFGNSYVDRNSETYLLLKDGSAYAYDWSFTPADFNAAYSKREEPKSWERWQRKNGSYVLTDGSGKHTDLSDFSRINAVPKGLRLKNSYDYLSVRATSQSSSLLGFNADGTFVTTNSTPLVGGLVANSYVASTPPDSSQTKGRYEINGYTLTFTTSDGRVSRMFFGIPEFEKNPKNPEWIYFGGLLYSS